MPAPKRNDEKCWQVMEGFLKQLAENPWCNHDVQEAAKNALFHLKRAKEPE